MIQAYSEKNTNFSRNGNVVLIPDEALLSAELNGPWVLNLHHPIDKKERWKHLTENAVLKVSSFNGDQLFRIYNREKSDGGISVQAYPIFFDAGRDCFLTDVRPTGKNGQQALDIICAGTKYSGESNITRATTAYYIRKNLMEAINGDLDQSFTNRWGGEILYDNYKVIINERVGGDYGTELRYGKNIPSDGIKETIDMSGVVTRIYPKAFNGHVLSGSGYVDSPNIDAYPVAMCSELQFEDVKMREDAQEDDEKNGVIVCDTQAELDNALIQKCRDQFAAGIDKPKVSISADMILLQDTDQYKDYKVLESVSLGDTTHCKHSKLGIVTDARVIALEYDCIQKRVTSVELGDFKNDYFDRVTSSTGKVESIINPDGTIMAEKVQGILNGIYTQLKLQSTVAQKVKGRAFTVEDLDPDSPLYGCMTWGTQGLQLATRRTADGRDWDWTTAVTAQGIVADAIITGLLSDKTGRNYWNLDTGEFRLSADAFKVDDQTVEDYINGKIDNATAQIRLLTMQLSNDMCSVATEADGTGGDYSECYTEVMLLIGTTDITDSDKAQYTVNPSAGVDGSWDLTRKRYTVRDMSEDNGSVTITATYAGITVSKVFSVSKAKAGEPGTNGDSVESITEYYAVSSSSTVAPSQWYKTPPQMTEHNRYLWNYETFIYSDGRTEDTPKHVIGVYGATGQDGEDGKGISDITKYYLATSQASGVTTSTYGWTTSVQNMTEQKKYLWNYEIITYTDKTTQTIDPYIIGVYGDKGLPGAPGTDGRTSYVHIKFSDVPDPQYNYQIKESPAKYIGIYVDFTELDSTSPSRYTWTQFMGDNGKDGEDGIGIPGEDGKTSYVHFAYANSADGRTGFSTTDSTNKLYIGQYVDYIQTDSTDPSRYSWSRIKGEDGRTYILQSDTLVIKQGANNAYTPRSVTFSSFYRDGTTASRTPYSGRFKIEESTNGTSYYTEYTSYYDESSHTHTPTSTDVKSIRCTLYASGGTSTPLDVQSVAVVRDVDNLTQEEIFNILTDNGRLKGIYMKDGELYISASYILSGILKLGGINNGNGRQDIYDNRGNLIGRLDNNGLTFFYDYFPNGSSYSYKGVVISKNGVRYVQEAIFTDGTQAGYEEEPVITFSSSQDGMDGLFKNLDATKATIASAVLNNITKMLVSGDATFSSKPKFNNGLNVADGNVQFPGWKFNGRFLESTDGHVKIRDKDGIARLESGNFQIMYGLDLYLAGQSESGDFGDGGNPFNIYGLGTAVGSNLVINGNSVYRSSSSKRYKTIGRNVSEEDIEKWYQIQPVWAKYKNDYVNRNSSCFNKAMPMLIAEDVETYLPTAAVKNEEGLTDDWSERILIPAMFAMIKSQKEQIDAMKKEIEEIKRLQNNQEVRKNDHSNI
jgi:phage minor structural protein